MIIYATIMEYDCLRSSIKTIGRFSRLRLLIGPIDKACIKSFYRNNMPALLRLLNR